MALFISLARSLYIILHSTMEIQFGTEFYRSASVNIHFHKVIAIIFFISSPGATSFPKPLMMIIENDFSIVVSRPVMSMLSILIPNQTTNNHNHNSILTIICVFSAATTSRNPTEYRQPIPNWSRSPSKLCFTQWTATCTTLLVPR